MNDQILDWLNPTLVELEEAVEHHYALPELARLIDNSPDVRVYPTCRYCGSLPMVRLGWGEIIFAVNKGQMIPAHPAMTTCPTCLGAEEEST